MTNEVTIHVKAKDDASKTIGAVGTNTKKMGVQAGVAAAVVGTVLVKALKDSITAAREAYKVTQQTNAVIKSTGGIANVSAKDVDKLATSLSKKTGIDDESIASGENLLLTFTKVRNEVGKGNDIFNQGTQAALDMSVALGKDMTSSAMLVGKALNDPIKGMTALTRAGIQFTDQQKEQIKKSVEAGDMLGAQKIILKELETQFGGSAEASATWADKAQVAFENVEEAIGTALLPVLEDVSKWFVEEGAADLETFVGGLEDLISGIDDLGSAMDEHLIKGQGGGLSEMADAWLEVKARILGYMDDIASAGAKLGLVPDEFADAIHDMRVKADAEMAAAVKRWNETEGDIRRKPVIAQFKAEKKDLDSKIRAAKHQLDDPKLTATKRAKLEAKIDRLIAAKKRAQAVIDSLHGKTVTINAYWAGSAAVSRARAAVGRGLTAYAGGGTVGGLSHAAEGGPRGGQVLVGERGPEIVDLPMGSHVNSNPDSRRMMGQGKGSGQTVVFNFNGPVYGDHAALQRALVDMKRRGQLDVVLR